MQDRPKSTVLGRPYNQDSHPGNLFHQFVADFERDPGGDRMGDAIQTQDPGGDGERSEIVAFQAGGGGCELSPMRSGEYSSLGQNHSPVHNCRRSWIILNAGISGSAGINDRSRTIDRPRKGYMGRVDAWEELHNVEMGEC